MQVSWIDPEEVAALAESLRPSLQPKTPASPPAAPPKPEPVEPLVSEQTVATAEEPVPEPNLSAFRQRLQSIREKAINAGLLTPMATPPAPPAQPVPTPEPAPAPQPEPEQEEPEASAEQEPLQESPITAESLEEPAPEPAFTPNPPPVHFSQAPVYAPQVPVPTGASMKERLEAYSLWATRQWNAAELLIVDEYGDLLWGPPKKSGLVLSTMMAWNAAIRASAQAASGAAQTSQQTLATGETLTIIPCQTRLGVLQIAVVKPLPPGNDETVSLSQVLAEVMDIAG